MNPVLDYVIEKGLEHKVVGEEVNLKVCPFCGKADWKLYVNQNSRLFLCHHASCQAKGHISTLKKKVGDIIEIKGYDFHNKEEKDFTELVENCHLALLEREEVIKYLDDNGLTIESIRRFKLGIRKIDKNLWLVYPSFVGNSAKYVKYRIIPFDYKINEEEKEAGLSKFKREKDAKSILFNQDCIEKFPYIIVTEGERDAITLLSHGYENVVGCTGGAGTLLPEWFDLLKEKERIYLAFDSDEAGTKAAREVWAQRLGYSKCFNIQIPSPIKDVTEYFLAGNTKDNFDLLLSSSNVFEIPGIRSISAILQEMATEPEEENIIPTPWANVNELLGGGMRKGQLIALAAPPKIGKTSLALQLSAHLTSKLHIPTLFFCMEMTYEALTQLFVSYVQNRPWYEFKAYNNSLLALEFENVPMFIGYQPRVTPVQVSQTFLEMRDRFGVEFFVFDNLHTLIRDHTNVPEKVGAASKMFKDLSMEMHVPILLIAQPRKIAKDEVMYYYDIRDSSSVPADADVVCILHRNRAPTEEGVKKSSFDSLTRFIVDASRWSAGGECQLVFVDTYRQFEELDLQ